MISHLVQISCVLLLSCGPASGDTIDRCRDMFATAGCGLILGKPPQNKPQRGGQAGTFL